MFSASGTPSLRVSGASSLPAVMALIRGKEDKNAAALLTLFSSFRSFKSSIDRLNFCSRSIKNEFKKYLKIYYIFNDFINNEIKL